jgi:transposase-like protein
MQQRRAPGKKRFCKVRFYSNGQYGLQDVLEHAGITAGELHSWRAIRGAPSSSSRLSRDKKTRVSELKSQITHLRRERQAVRDAIVALAKAATLQAQRSSRK